MSTVSTADGEASPELPPIPVPQLPDRVRGILRTPPPPSSEHGIDHDRYRAAGWGSPYPEHLRHESPSSGPSEESPIHHLEIYTPFLRPTPLSGAPGLDPFSSSLASATVLANRARRPARGLTEDWIRQHTARDEDSEKRHWLSDGAGESENSSLSGSFSGEDAAWLGSQDLRTPRASLASKRASRLRDLSRGYPRTRSSNETLRQADLTPEPGNHIAMATPTDNSLTPEGIAEDPLTKSSQEPAPAQDVQNVPQLSVGTPKKEDSSRAADNMNGSVNAPKGANATPATPPRAPVKRAPVTTPRLRKKVPWKGKNIMVLLPRDGERGQPEKAPLPLNQETVANMYSDWENLGYSIRGFDLSTAENSFVSTSELSQSKGPWPDFDDLGRERAQRNYKVLLPDLNGKLIVQRMELRKIKVKANFVAAANSKCRE